jgi:hypothetical protein
LQHKKKNTNKNLNIIYKSLQLNLINILKKKKLGPGYYSIQSEKEKPHSNIGLLDALSDRFSGNEINQNPGN